jgi:predicted translin family RNA/ssDNA-binding protein
MKELIALKERIEFRDDLRETLIKKCRDGQKLAKQCIFALHRNPTDSQTPQAMLRQCSKYIQEDLFPIVQEEPPLRYGSFASVLEEYVEAKLFYTWLHGRDTKNAIVSTGVVPTTTDTTSDQTTFVVSGIILVPQDFMMDEFIQLQPEEYIGGLCDLTGEIGRFAVQRGTVRDVASIKQCWYSNTMIYNAIQSMNRISSSASSYGSGGSSSSKKLDTVRSNVLKIERMLYEISLSEAAGHGRTIHTDAPTNIGVDED